VWPSHQKSGDQGFHTHVSKQPWLWILLGGSFPIRKPFESVVDLFSLLSATFAVRLAFVRERAAFGVELYDA